MSSAATPPGPTAPGTPSTAAARHAQQPWPAPVPTGRRLARLLGADALVTVLGGSLAVLLVCVAISVWQLQRGEGFTLGSTMVGTISIVQAIGAYRSLIEPTRLVAAMLAGVSHRAALDASMRLLAITTLAELPCLVLALLAYRLAPGIGTVYAPVSQGQMLTAAVSFVLAAAGANVLAFVLGLCVKRGRGTVLLLIVLVTAGSMTTSFELPTLGSIAHALLPSLEVLTLPSTEGLRSAGWTLLTGSALITWLTLTWEPRSKG